MLFDKLCGTAELSLHNDAIRMCKSARIFDFTDWYKKADLNEKIPRDYYKDLNDSFIPPFDIFCVEYGGEFTFVIESLSKEVGFPSKYRGIIYAEVGHLDCTYKNKKVNRVMEIIEFEVIGFDINNKIKLKKGKFETFNGYNTGVTKRENIEYKQGIEPLEAAFIFISQIYQKDRFILESSSTKKRNNKSNKIARSHDRPKYTILKPKEIRTKTGMSSGITGNKRSPHERRAHCRVLRHKRYGENIGKTIKIKSTWIGESEKVVGNKKYKVIL